MARSSSCAGLSFWPRGCARFIFGALLVLIVLDTALANGEIMRTLLTEGGASARQVIMEDFEIR